MDYRRRRNCRRGRVYVEPPSAKNGGVESQYRVIRELGRGGFAKVYSVEHIQTGDRFALKVVQKSGMKKRHREKLKSEIKIHSLMDHPFVCRFDRCFEDKDYVYILMELCTNQTLLELVGEMSLLTEDEARCFMIPLIEAVKHLHQNRVIHRDLKLGNLFLDRNLSIKLGDFGLAAKLDYDDQRKHTVCGTPNYIAPEILQRSEIGHSYEVDVWAIGVVLYTLLVGRPPFETVSVRRTYQHIRQNRWRFPRDCGVSHAARSLVSSILQTDPDRRPSVFDLLDDPWFRLSSSPRPTIRLTLTRRLLRWGREQTGSSPRQAVRVPLSPRTSNRVGSAPSEQTLTGPNQQRAALGRVETEPRSETASSTLNSNARRRQRDSENPSVAFSSSHSRAKRTASSTPSSSSSSSPSAPLRPDTQFLLSLHGRLSTAVANSSPTSTSPRLLSTPTPTSLRPDGPFTPSLPTACLTTIRDFADYSSKYGLAYRFHDGMVGAFFNDFTMMLYNARTSIVKYYCRRSSGSSSSSRGRGGGNESYYEEYIYSTIEFPDSVKKKMVLIKYFTQHFDETHGVLLPLEDTDCSTYVKMYLKTNDAYVFRFSDPGHTIQVHFNDSSELILFGSNDAAAAEQGKKVQYQSRHGVRETFLLTDLESGAITMSDSVGRRLRYTKNVLYTLIMEQREEEEELQRLLTDRRRQLQVPAVPVEEVGVV